jgi:dTDP-4-dehydrorhamnose reductase
MNREHKKIMIVGASSKAAEGITRVLASETDYSLVYLTTKNIGDFANDTNQRRKIFQVDFTNRTAVKEICLQEKPNVIINTAAYTNVDGCETHKQDCWRVNVQGVENLVYASRVTDAHLIHFSTDYLFDGENGPYPEDAKPNPIGYYGKSKLASENVCQSSTTPSTVIRTNVLYGATVDRKPNFVTWVLDKLLSTEPFMVVDDQFSNPTIIDDLGWAVLRIIEKQATGIYNVAGADWCSRYDFAQKIAEVFKLNPANMKKVATADLGQKAPRPMKGGLVTLKAQTDLGIRLAGIEDGLFTMRRQLQLMGFQEWKL